MAGFREEIIGEHRLILGDCLEVMAEMAAVDHVICDPPFEALMHELHASTRLRRTDGGNERSGLTFVGINEIRPAFAALVAEKSNGWFLAFCNAEGVGEWRKAVVATPMKFKTTCIWVKPDCLPKLNGQGPAVGYEPFITVWAGNGYAKWNAGGKRGVYTHLTNPPTREGTHPTEKPLRLMDELLSDFTNFGQTVLDPFMGSGSTIVSCVRTGRIGTGIEQKMEYFDLACRRVEEAVRQPRLNLEPAPKAVQPSLDLSGGNV